MHKIVKVIESIPKKKQTNKQNIQGTLARSECQSKKLVLNLKLGFSNSADVRGQPPLPWNSNSQGCCYF